MVVSGSSVPLEPSAVGSLPAKAVIPAAVPLPAAHQPASSVTRKPVRRRPSGEAPPLPHQLNASGRWWLLLASRSPCSG